ncbi:MAG: TonB-dependent receptor [Tidjanibacter sp.]|nr:TonB-dependent receptor [Tidjanibacter sp.]
MKKFYTLIVSLFVAMSAMAQVTTSSMSGKVTSNDGTALVGATVIAVHTPSGTQYAAVVDGNGVYRLANVRPGGPYTIEFEYIGYRTLRRQDVTIGLGDNYTLNATLSPEGQEIEAIVVTGDGLDSNMRSSNAGAQTTISTRIMESMPTVSRSMNDLMKLTPQATTTSNGLAIGGGNYRQSYVTVDGAAFNNAFGIGGSLPAGGAPISLDALEQMSVNITPFDVRQSGFTGGAINAVTKSGTNQYKVAVYDYYTSDALIGTRYADLEGKVNELELNESLSNTIGFNIGGPIIKNKLFFFVNFEYENNVSPGQNRKAYDGSQGEWTSDIGDKSQFNRPTAEQMETIKGYLKDTYNYDPGRYQDYSIQIPNYKVMARLDWNINKDHKFNLRYSYTKNKYSSDPSSSITPLEESLTYTRKPYGRTSNYALYFESSRYYQEQNFSSWAAELNSSFLDGQLNNTFRATYSHQYEPRSFEGGVFPTVDILQDYVDSEGKTQKTVLTSFGPDPFTYGNLRDVNTVVVTDELTFHKGIHNFVGGLQYEYDNTKNGFMQGGAGYYVYNSWDDFVNDEAPLAFAITHANRDDLQQVYPSFDFHQVSAYIQDEMNISNNFKLTAGLRLELPFYPNIAGNENKAFTEMYKDYGGYKTSDMPTATLNVSPRVGFNWDVMGDRSLVLRGGSGIYTGRLPFVWLVSVAGNSNCMQMQYNTTRGDELPSGFHTNINDILTDIYGGAFKAGDLAAPSGATILDKDLKMPTTWKTSLAADFDLPFGIKGSIEGIYNKDLVSVAVTKTGLKEGEVQLPGEPAPRVSYSNIEGVGANAYLISNEGIDKQGYYASLTATLKKDFACGLSLYGAYTYSTSKNVIDGIGDQVNSAFGTNTFGVNGSNSHELGYSSYVSPHRLVLNANYRFEYGKGKFATTVGLFYEGYNFAFVGEYSYSRSSYTLSSNVNGDKGSYSLMYIPTEKELDGMTFSSEENKAAFNEFIENDKYLSQNRGEYSERGAVVMPWYNQFNLKINQDINFMVAGRKQTVQFGLDIKNFGNLLNPAWGNIKKWGGEGVLSLNKDNTYTFTTDLAKWSVKNSTISTWSMLLSARYFF